MVRVWAMVLPLPADAPVMLPAGAMLTVQVKVVAGRLVSVTPVVPPEQRVSLDGVATTFGRGFTVTVISVATPEHRLRVGVTW